MIIFHEGLPRSGKSYEAMVLQIIPALQKGRPVDMYLEGPDSRNPDCPFMAKIAEVAEMPLARVFELVRSIPEAEVRRFHEVTRDNSLIVLDEAQDFWPTGRQKLDDATTKAITQHGHRGQDILLMGQVFTDVHKLWRGRVSQKNHYLKLDAVGLEARYSVEVAKARRPERFEKVTFNPKGVYDPKYFGTYKSHVSTDIQTENFKDARANVKNTFFVQWTLPIAGGLFLWGCWFIYGYFNPTVPPKGTPIAGASPGASAVVVAPPPPPPPVAKQAKSVVEQWNEKYRPRLSFMFQRGGAHVGAVEWYDGDVVRERLTFVELVIMGATVEVKGSLVQVAGTWVTPWPVKVQTAPSGAAVMAPTMNAVGSVLGS